MNIDPTTFIKTGDTCHGNEVGTVLVDGKPHRALRTKYSVQLHGYIGRYRTSAKAWPATVSQSPNGLWIDFGRDDRVGRFHKQNAISYEPALYDTLVNPAFWAAI